MNFMNKLVNKSEMEDMNTTTQRTNAGDDFFLDFGKKKIRHFRQIVPVQIHHFYIIDEIREVDAYVEMINTLKTSEQHDTIFIYLNTPGGNLITTLQIMAAIKQSAATVITCMEGQVASAGTMIFLSGHRHIVSPNTIFMAHNYSAGTFGKGYELKTRQKFDELYFDKLVKDMYTGFLTEQEISDIKEDRDVWLDAEQVVERLRSKIINPSSTNDEAQNFLAALLGTQADATVADAAKAPEKIVEEVVKKPAKKSTSKTPAKKATKPTKKSSPEKKKATTEES